MAFCNFSRIEAGNSCPRKLKQFGRFRQGDLQANARLRPQLNHTFSSRAFEAIRLADKETLQAITLEKPAKVLYACLGYLLPLSSSRKEVWAAGLRSSHIKKPKYVEKYVVS